MPENITYLTGRKAYEFRPDDLRLSALSVKPVQDAIQELFHFQSSAIGTPMSTFGEVPLTIPPGIVFNTGVWQMADNQFAPIRFLHFEPRRIVIDLAGPSTTLTAIFDQLQHFFAEIHTADGAPLIGTPDKILDYSEISARFPFFLDAILLEPLRKILSSITKEPILAPTLIVKPYLNLRELPGTTIPGDAHAFTLSSRAGTRPEDHIYFSSAPLDSEAHLNYLKDLEAALTS